MDSRVAILDLGTNTFHLLIADIKERDRPVIVYHETIAVKLGEGGIAKGTISPAAFERGIKAVTRFKDRIDHYEASKVKSAATSAVRSAENGTEFLEKVRERTGLDLEIIDGEQEAELIYQGVRAAVNMEEVSLIVDIGGGSVEFIICDKNQLLWKKSYPIGTARMMAQFHHSDPISGLERRQLNTYLDETLTDFKEQLGFFRPRVMIGSAGAFETFAELQGMQLKASFENPEQVIDIDSFGSISEMLLRSTHAEREQMPEITPVRVDMIVVATILTSYILSVSEIKILKLSSYSLKEGILFGLIK